MAARKKNAPVVPPGLLAEGADPASASSAVAALPEVGMSPARAAEMPPRYAALRVIHQVSSLRGGSNISIIEATGLRTIEAHGHPYPHFKVLPEGVEIPTTNVSSAIPAGSAQTLKLGRKERLRAREERIAAKLAAKAAAAPKQREGVEDIVDEDDTDFGDEVVEPGDSEVSE